MFTKIAGLLGALLFTSACGGDDGENSGAPSGGSGPGGSGGATGGSSGSGGAVGGSGGTIAQGGSAGGGQAGASGAGGATCPTPTVTVLRTPGGRLDWHPNGTELVYDLRNPLSTCYDVHRIKADGTGDECVTCNVATLPPNNKGQPAWHPNGRHLIFQAEKAAHDGNPCGFAAHPGVGIYNDIWVLDTQTGQAKAIYVVADGVDHGVLHPHFSPDGTKLLWSEAYQKANAFSPGLEAGKWSLMIADVSIAGDGTMQLAPATKLLPTAATGEGFIESHGFTPSGTRLQFSSNYGSKINIDQRSDVWLSDLNGQNWERITDAFYNEHLFASKSEKKVVWMTGRWNPKGTMSGGTEWAMADSAGKNVCRLTYFNEPGHPESQSKETAAADLSWHPDGTKFAGYSHESLVPEIIWLVDFKTVQ